MKLRKEPRYAPRPKDHYQRVFRSRKLGRGSKFKAPRVEWEQYLQPEQRLFE